MLRYLRFVFIASLIARFMGPTWSPSGADRTQVGPMLTPLTLLSGLFYIFEVQMWIGPYLSMCEYYTCHVGVVLKSYKTSYYKITWRFGTEWNVFRDAGLLWHLPDVLQTLLSRRLPDFKAIRPFYQSILRLRHFGRYYDKICYVMMTLIPSSATLGPIYYKDSTFPVYWFTLKR